MKIVVQNLQKQPGLACALVDQFRPDMFLAQEINLYSEQSHDFSTASYTSKRSGYGTAIYTKDGNISNVRRVLSPHAEFGGTITKKTVVADCAGVQCITFHGYNGSPFHSVSKLVDHVRAVLAVIPTEGPAIFAGDFNTWTQAHLEAVKAELQIAGFHLCYSWSYPGRDLPLDHVFLRGIILRSANSFTSKSDHKGAVIDIEVSE